MKHMPSLFRRNDPNAKPASRPILKSPREVELMRAAGRVVRRVLDEVGTLVRPGVPTSDLSHVAETIIRSAEGVALFRGVETTHTKFPFPAALCVSVNDEVVHGIPGDRRLDEGDIVSIDCGVRLKGYCGDAAMTYPVGRIRPQDQRLLNVTQAALALAIERMRPGMQWSIVAGEIQRLVERAGFSVVREFVGHGIGTDMHEEPKVPNYTDRKQRKSDFLLQPGLVLAVEPMVAAGRPAVRCRDSSGWTQTTSDGSRAAHFEHTVAITENGVDVLTDGR